MAHDETPSDQELHAKQSVWNLVYLYAKRTYLELHLGCQRIRLDVALVAIGNGNMSNQKCAVDCHQGALSGRVHLELRHQAHIIRNTISTILHTMYAPTGKERVLFAQEEVQGLGTCRKRRTQ